VLFHETIHELISVGGVQVVPSNLQVPVLVHGITILSEMALAIMKTKMINVLKYIFYVREKIIIVG
jgi:hypothetical protein